MPPKKKSQAPIADEPIEAAAPDVAPALPEPMPVSHKPMVLCHTVVTDLWHPDQARWIPTSPPVEVVLDNWLKSQIKGGLVKVVE